MRDSEKLDGKPMPTTKHVIRKHTDLDVYKRAQGVAMEIFRLSKRFPMEERFSLTDQIRRASRSVCTNIAEGWRKRRYPLSFVSKLNDSEAEAAETQSWIEFAVKCQYVNREEGARLYKEYDEIIAMLVYMITHIDDWKFRSQS
jgi:four helix bundle protein